MISTSSLRTARSASYLRTALHRLYERLHRLHERLCNGSATALQRLYAWLFERLYERLFERLYERLYDGSTIAHTMVSANGSASSLRRLTIARTVAYNRLYDGSATVLQQLYNGSASSLRTALQPA